MIRLPTTGSREIMGELPEVLQTDEWVEGWRAARHGVAVELRECEERGFKRGWNLCRSTQQRYFGGWICACASFIAGFVLAVAVFA